MGRVARLRPPKPSEAFGAAAFTHTVGDPDYDDSGEPITLAIFGTVPPGLSDQLPF